MSVNKYSTKKRHNDSKHHNDITFVEYLDKTIGKPSTLVVVECLAPWHSTKKGRAGLKRRLCAKCVWGGTRQRCQITEYRGCQLSSATDGTLPSVLFCRVLDSRQNILYRVSVCKCSGIGKIPSVVECLRIQVFGHRQNTLLPPSIVFCRGQHSTNLIFIECLIFGSR